MVQVQVSAVKANQAEWRNQVGGTKYTASAEQGKEEAKGGQGTSVANRMAPGLEGQRRQGMEPHSIVMPHDNTGFSLVNLEFSWSSLS